jgi:hypothetical protein
MKRRRKRPTFSMQFLVNSSQSTNNLNKKQALPWEIVDLTARPEKPGSQHRLLPCLWWTSLRRKKSWINLGREVETNLDRETSQVKNRRKSHQQFEEGWTRQQWDGMTSKPIDSD